MVRGCALDSGTLTTDTELIRMSHCGSFYFEDKYVGCGQSIWVIIFIVQFCLADTFMDASKVAMIQKHAILVGKPTKPPFQRYSFCYCYNSNFSIGKKLEEKDEETTESKAKL